MREVTLPSGKILKVHPAPFSESKALYKAILAECKEVGLSSQTEVSQVLKDVFCIAFSSDRIEQALNACMKRCLYDNLKIDADTFESIESRQDYTKVCLEVAHDNIHPFAKDLFALLQQFSTVPGIGQK